MSSLVLSEAFEGHPLTFVRFHGEPLIVAREIATALGYANTHGIANLIRNEWAEDFVEGEDFRVLSGPALREFKELVLHGGTSQIDPRAPSLIVLTESGMWTVAQKTEKELGVKLRRFLAREVLPKLARGEAIMPAGPVPSAVQTDPALALLNEAVRLTVSSREYARDIGDTKGEAMINRQIPRICLAFVPKRTGKASEATAAPSNQLALPVADPIESAWISLVEAWAASGKPSDQRKASEVLAYAPSEILDTLNGNHARGRAMSFGHMLSQRNDHVYGPWRIKKHGNGYALVKVR